jgi:putative ABC transport system permease protein
MWRNFIVAAIRNTWKNRIYISINVVGLGISIAFCMTLYLIYAYNWEFDSYYTGTKNIYHVQELKQGNGYTRFDCAPFAMGPRIASEIAGVEEQTRYMVAQNENVKYEDLVFDDNIAYVDTNFFDLFRIGLQSGSFALLKTNSSVYFTRELAEKFFGDSDPLGKIVTVFHTSGRSIDLMVAGVFNRIPLNSTFQFGALTSIDNIIDGYDIQADQWAESRQPTLLLKLKDRVDTAAVAKMINRYIPIQNNAREEWKVSRFELVSFRDSKILKGSVTNFSYGNLRINTGIMIIFSSMAILIFLIACFNLANTTMALMGNRVKEVGVRKVMGGTTSQIIIQFIFEMAWISLLAVVLGFTIFQYISLEFFSLWDMHLMIEDINAYGLLLAFIVILVITTLIAGIYPALYSKKFQPAAIFQNRHILRRAGPASVILNALQFMLSIMVLACGMIFLKNETFIHSLDLGYQRDNIINIPVKDKTEFNLMRDRIKNIPIVTDWCYTKDILGRLGYENTILILDTSEIEIPFLKISGPYLDMMHVHLNQGRFFNKDEASDYTDAVIVNQAFVDHFNLNDPIGKMINLKDGKRYIIGVTSNVIGSVFNGYEIMPEIFLEASEDESLGLVVRSESENNRALFNTLADSWKKLIIFRPFPGFHQDSLALGNAEQTSRNLRTIILYLGIIGAFLSLTGVFALSSLNVASRVKEIGIRRVMGATPKTILFALNRIFALQLGISIITGMIFAYFFADYLLSRIYEYHTTVSFGIIFTSGFFVFFMALLTTSSTIFKTAITNPSKILRSE